MIGSILRESDIVKEGRVMKQAKIWGWNNRHLVLTRAAPGGAPHGRISYFENSQDRTKMAPRKTFALVRATCRIVNTRDKVVFEVKPSNEQPALEFAVASTGDRDAWIREICRVSEAIAPPPPPRQAAPPQPVGAPPQQPAAVAPPPRQPVPVPPPQRQQQQQQQQQQPVYIRCPTCSQTIQPPPGHPRCQCPHCRQVMQIPLQTQQQLARLAAMPPQQQSAAQPTDAGGGAGAVSVRTLASAAQNAAADTRRRAREQMLRQQRLLTRQNTQVLVRCPRCMRTIAPPPGAEQCRCPHCSGVMAIPRETQARLAEQQRQVEEARRQQQVDMSQQQEYLESLDVPDLPQTLGGHRWLKRIKERENRCVWLPASRSDGKSLLEKVEADGWVRRLTPSGIEMVPAEEGYTLVLGPGMTAAAPAAAFLQDLQKVSELTFRDKRNRFREYMTQLQVPWEMGHQKIPVKRSDLMETSFQAVMKLKPAQMRETWRFQFVGEEGIDAGGLAREWFSEVSKHIFNVDFGLFGFSGAGNTAFQISPHSGIANERHLEYFRFAGRIIGKALLDGQTMHANVVRPLFKHMIGAPLTFSDIEHIDAELYNNMKQVCARYASGRKSLAGAHSPCQRPLCVPLCDALRRCWRCHQMPLVCCAWTSPATSAYLARFKPSS